MTSLEKILKFVELTNQLQKVERTIYIKGKNRLENDLEHQYQLAMLAWYLVSSEKLNLNTSKVLQYALIHDIVEVYAGDTFFFGKRAGKTARELKAAQRLQKEFPEFKDLHQLIHNYEARKDKESRFVYALDKILPMYNIYLDNGRTWRKHKLTLKLLIDKKKRKVGLSPELKNHFTEISALIGSKEKELF